MTGSGRPLRIGLVDDHRMFAEGLAMVLTRAPRVASVDIASSSVEAVELLRTHVLDVILLDVDLNDQPAEQTIHQLRRVDDSVCIVILTMHTYPPLLASLLRAGARAALNKSLSAGELLDAVVAATSSTFAESQENTRVGQSGLLSDRELEVLREASLAKSNRQIASRLSISDGTVKRHLHQINVKLNATSRLDAVRKAERLGLL